MKTLIINSGSSSLKFKVLSETMETEFSGLFDKIGAAQGIYTAKKNEEKFKEEFEITNHDLAIEFLVKQMKEQEIISDINEIKAVGHRVAHGGEQFTKTTEITLDNLIDLEAVSGLAPLHNPVSVKTIRLFLENYQGMRQFAIFDTAFHQTLPAYNYLYPLPTSYYKEDQIRKYGFHGTSHQFVSLEANKLYPEDTKVISCHIGNGASICAIKDGKSLNTSMGFTPLAGLMMGTRTGDIDPSIIPFIMEKHDMQPNDIVELINKKSGLLGVSGLSNDLREIESEANNGNEQCQLAIDMYVNRIQGEISKYITELEGLDTLIFTAGVGENSRSIRKAVLSKFAYLGLELDEQRNLNNEIEIHSKDSKIKVLVIPTDEELMMGLEVKKNS